MAWLWIHFHDWYRLLFVCYAIGWAYFTFDMHQCICSVITDLFLSLLVSHNIPMTYIYAYLHAYNIYVCILSYIHVYIHTDSCRCLNITIHIYIQTHMHAHACLTTCIHIYILIHAWYMHTNSQTDVHTCLATNIHMSQGWVSQTLGFIVHMQGTSHQYVSNLKKTDNWAFL